ncbi:hypothetical protein MPQ_1120 [Methylovorus sp. MP688]|nr:hypothetical protein MPQ_1120 [Methylovorus sp. MP688]
MVGGIKFMGDAADINESLGHALSSKGWICGTFPAGKPFVR